jgi:hypothetical protein
MIRRVLVDLGAGCLRAMRKRVPSSKALVKAEQSRVHLGFFIEDAGFPDELPWATCGN